MTLSRFTNGNRRFSHLTYKKLRFPFECKISCRASATVQQKKYLEGSTADPINPII
jgi:hypothetical protein